MNPENAPENAPECAVSPYRRLLAVCPVDPFGTWLDHPDILDEFDAELLRISGTAALSFHAENGWRVAMTMEPTTAGWLMVNGRIITPRLFYITASVMDGIKRGAKSPPTTDLQYLLSEALRQLRNIP